MSFCTFRFSCDSVFELKALQVKMDSSYRNEINSCTLLFEVLGLQFFSLKSLDYKTVNNAPSLKRKMHLICTLMLIFCTNALVVSRHEYGLEEKLSANTIFMLAIQYSMNVILIVVDFLGIIKSYTSTKKFQEIFINTFNILQLIEVEFKIKVDFAEVRRIIWKKNVILIGFVGLFYLLYVFLEVKKISDLLHFVLLFFSYLYIVGIVLKFQFLVLMTNSHLKLIGEALNMLLIKQSDQLTFLIPFAVKPAKIDAFNRKILTIRKVFNITNKNAKLINDCMGFQIFLILTALVILLTIMGYRLFILVLDNKDFTQLYGKIYVTAFGIAILLNIVFACQETQNMVSFLNMKLHFLNLNE